MLVRFSPGFSPPLSVHRPQLLPGDGKLCRVDHFGFPTAVCELQRAIPLALRFAHDGVGRVVFDLRCHSEWTNRQIVVVYIYTRILLLLLFYM